MDNSEKIAELRKEIERVVRPLITGDCHLTNLPFHTNIGDSLIWNGAKALIESTGFRCLSETSFFTWRNRKVKSGDVIVFDGGGNIGDLWRPVMDFMLDVIDRFHDNRIIVFPNSVWYDDKRLIELDAERMAQHPDLHLIARDSQSFDFFQRRFYSNNIYLAPDMAFYVPPTMLASSRKVTPKPGSVLYLRRTDKEYNPNNAVNIQATTVSDWPTMTAPVLTDRIYPHCVAVMKLLNMPGVCNMIGRRCARDRYVGIGAGFIARYESIITTRLHTMILSVLVGRPVRYIDNKSGKLSAFAETWLSNLQSVRPI